MANLTKRGIAEVASAFLADDRGNEGFELVPGVDFCRVLGVLRTTGLTILPDWVRGVFLAEPEVTFGVLLAPPKTLGVDFLAELTADLFEVEAVVVDDLLGVALRALPSLGVGILSGTTRVLTPPAADFRGFGEFCVSVCKLSLDRLSTERREDLRLPPPLASGLSVFLSKVVFSSLSSVLGFASISNVELRPASSDTRGDLFEGDDSISTESFAAFSYYISFLQVKKVFLWIVHI